MKDRDALHQLVCGMQIVSAKLSDGTSAGCVVNTVSQVAMNPPMVGVAMAKGLTTTKAIEESGAYTVGILSTKATESLIELFGDESSLKVDKFKGTELVSLDGLPCVKEGCVAGLSVKVTQTVDVGDHLFYIGSLQQAVMFDDDEPLSYAQYHASMKK